MTMMSDSETGLAEHMGTVGIYTHLLWAGTHTLALASVWNQGGEVTPTS